VTCNGRNSRLGLGDELFCSQSARPSRDRRVEVERTDHDTVLTTKCSGDVGRMEDGRTEQLRAKEGRCCLFDKLSGAVCASYGGRAGTVYTQAERQINFENCLERGEAAATNLEFCGPSGHKSTLRVARGLEEGEAVNGLESGRRGGEELGLAQLRSRISLAVREIRSRGGRHRLINILLAL